MAKINLSLKLNKSQKQQAVMKVLCSTLIQFLSLLTYSNKLEPKTIKQFLLLHH